jgi:FAD/FMN-containing dehydrogenase
MTRTLTSYDGGVVSTPQKLVRPRTVEELQMVLRDRERFPSPVRPMGSFHSLTPCTASAGTVVDMKGLRAIIAVDTEGMTITAQAGIQHVDAAAALRARNLQFMLNIEIGNATLGSLATCHSKDSLDGVEHGQVSSYVSRIKWVSPSGELIQASEAESPELLSLVRSSYGLAGIVYEVTLRIKPLEMVDFGFRVLDVDDLTTAIVDEAIATNESLVFWTLGRMVAIQTRNRATRLRNHWIAGMRQRFWARIGATLARAFQLADGTRLERFVGRSTADSAESKRATHTGWVSIRAIPAESRQKGPNPCRHHGQHSGGRGQRLTAARSVQLTRCRRPTGEPSAGVGGQLA